MAQDTRPINPAAGAIGQAVGPELVVQVIANVPQFVTDCRKPHWTKFAVTRQIQNPDHTVFRQGAGGNFQALLLKESLHCPMVNMGLVQQRDPDVDVKKLAQVKRPLDPSDRGHARS